MKAGAEKLAEALIASTANPRKTATAHLALFKYDPNEACGAGRDRLITLAAREEFLGVMSILMDYGADVNVLDAHGFSPLWYMAAYDDLSMAQTLLERGANPNFVSRLEATPPVKIAARAYILRELGGVRGTTQYPYDEAII